MLGFIMVILVTIPFSVYIAQKRQNISSKAIKSTTLSFEPASTTAKTGDTVTLNIWLDPGTGTTANQISFVKLAINFDKTKFTASSLTENIMEKIDGSFLIARTFSETSYSKAYYSYASIYLNLTTSSGWEKVATPEHYENLRNFSQSIYDKNCFLTEEFGKKLKNEYIIAYNEDCSFLETCNLTRINTINQVCLYKS